MGAKYSQHTEYARIMKQARQMWQLPILKPIHQQFNQVQSKHNFILQKYTFISSTSNQSQQSIQTVINPFIKQFNHSQQPYRYIGLVYSDDMNNKDNKVYGTGILIYTNIVLTSAQNVYSKRFDREYNNIKFVLGLNGRKHKGIFDIKRIHFPNEYCQNEKHLYFNFAILQLYEQLQDYGYISSKVEYKLYKQCIYSFGYVYDQKNNVFLLNQMIIKCKVQKNILYFNQEVRPLMIIDKQNYNYFLIGVQGGNPFNIGIYLSKEISKIIKGFTTYVELDFSRRFLRENICKYLLLQKIDNLTYLDLYKNQVGIEGCKYLKHANWPWLTEIDFAQNNIDAQCCKHIKEITCPSINKVIFKGSKIDDEGCRYLKEAKWIYLTQINFHNNKIGAEGCKYLMKAIWVHLKAIILSNNQIHSQGCKYLKDANWLYLKRIDLYNNNIDVQGFRYLRDTNWIDLQTIDVRQNNSLDFQIFKYLKDFIWNDSVIQMQKVNVITTILLTKSI